MSATPIFVKYTLFLFSMSLMSVSLISVFLISMFLISMSPIYLCLKVDVDDRDERDADICDATLYLCL